jgi:ligand-binding sensor domain-containing protein/signal transduction histidine kinase
VHSRIFAINVEVREYCTLFCLRELLLDSVAHNHANSMDAPGNEARHRSFWGRWGRSAGHFGILTAAFLLGWVLPGLALEPSTPLASYGRQTWVMENGLPQNTVQALVQTRDGFVWLGTEVGLVRFDGNGFQVFDKNSTPALPGNDVRCLLETRDGALWIGTSEGLARWKDGAVTAFTPKGGLPGSEIRALVESENGYLWAWTDQGLARLNDDGLLVDATATTGLQSSAISRVISDGLGGLWVGTQDRVSLYRNGRWILPESQGGMFPWIPTGPIEFIQTYRGRIASADKSTVAMLDGDYKRGDNAPDRFTTGKELPGSRVQSLLFDRKGSLWIGTNGGLARWVAEDKVQLMPVTDPLATASVLALMEDHEGNLWVGTETGGLHILRDQRFRTLGAREGLSSDATTAVVEDRAGTLWVGTNGSGLNAMRPESSATEAHPSHKNNGVARVGHPDLLGTQSKFRSYTVRDGLLSDVILSLAAAANGDLWVGTPDGLNRIRGGKVDAFTSADGLPDDFIRSLHADSDGSLWIGTRRGLTHWTLKAGDLAGARMETFTQANGLGSNLVGAMARDLRGDLWVATFAGLSRLYGDKITNYTTANGLSSNVITALEPRTNGTLLIGTQDHGWNLWDGQRFTAQTHDGTTQANLDRTTIHAILDDGIGHLWFATENGIARCDCAGAAMQGTQCSHWIEFGAADGLRSRETATNSHPSAWRTRDGHLWFATPKGLVEVDPAHFPVNAVAPPVALERFTVDDVAQPLRGAASVVEIPAGHVHFQFDYAGLSFAAPQKVRYRYKLEGFDRDWTEAGTRRSAYYTNIPAGRYTFRVQAANNDGVWSTEGAALTFVLRPHFYQTIWFYALLLAAVAGIIVVLLRLRLRRAEGEFRAVLGERNRIAREIHDTLAQGYVGISVQLEVLAELLRHNKPEAAEKHLDLTRGYVREGLADARQSIWALRSQDSGEMTLPVRLSRMVEAEGGHGLEAKFSIFGAYRAMPPGTEQEFLRVAQEAIHNAKKHAGANHLFVQLEYGPEEVALEVRDDGRGFAVEQESSPGHYGMTGMKERAAAIGGILEVTSELGAGTIVRLRAVPKKEKREQMKEQL